MNDSKLKYFKQIIKICQLLVFSCFQFDYLILLIGTTEGTREGEREEGGMICLVLALFFHFDNLISLIGTTEGTREGEREEGERTNEGETRQGNRGEEE